MREPVTPSSAQPSRADARRDLPSLAFTALAFGLPLALLLAHHDLGHEGDIAFFHDWYLAFREGPAFYRDGPGLNYPILGVLAVTGPAWLVESITGPLDASAFRLVLKLTLVLGEGLLVLALASLARALRVGRPRLAALAIYALPSTWAGGAWFGQIDVLGSALLVLAASALVRYRAAPRARWLGLGVLALHAAVLLKQLTLFSLPGLGLLLIAGLAACPPSARRTHVAWTVASAALLFVADPWLVLPTGYASHLSWVLLGGGSAHGDLIVGGGASLWSLLIGPDGGSSRTRLLAGVSVFHWSLALFLVSQLPALRWLARRRDDARAFVLYVGFANLAMATLLTGVHERYLAHGAPFLLLGLDAIAPPRWARAATVAIVAGWGLFVLASIHFDAPALWLFRRHEPIAALLLALLAGLLVAFVRQSSAPPDRDTRKTQ